jgi:hypothetical protein
MSVEEVLSGARPWWVERGDCVPWLAALPPDSVDLIVCSPPYEDARAYREAGQETGVARKTEEWVAWMLEVCAAASRACKGLCAFVVEGRTRGYRYTASPFLLAADLCRGGFNVRKPPAFCRVGIPGSGGPDWLRNDWEPVVCFSRKGRLPWSDPTACGAPPVFGPGGAMSHRKASGDRVRRDKRVLDGGPSSVEEQSYKPPDIANPGNVIRCPVGGGMMGGDAFASQNEAPYPEKLAEFFVLSFCPPGGVVCDPFSGSGTTGAVAYRSGRRFLGCDLRPSQVELSRRRIGSETPSLFAQTDMGESGAGAPAQQGLFTEDEG